MARRRLRRHSSAYEHLLDGEVIFSANETDERCFTPPIDQGSSSGGSEADSPPARRLRVRRTISLDGMRDKVGALRSRMAGFVKHL